MDSTKPGGGPVETNPRCQLVQSMVPAGVPVHLPPSSPPLGDFVGEVHKNAINNCSRKRSAVEMEKVISTLCRQPVVAAAKEQNHDHDHDDDAHQPENNSGMDDEDEVESEKSEGAESEKSEEVGSPGPVKYRTAPHTPTPSGPPLDCNTIDVRLRYLPKVPEGTAHPIEFV